MNTDTLRSSSPAPSLIGPWRLRFWTIWASQAFSLIGSALTQFVLIWWVTQTTGSTSALAIAGIVALLPQALLGPLGGTVADRFSRRAILILSDSISAACMLVLIWLFQSGQIQLWHVFVMMGIRSSMQAFQQPAAAASVAMLVPSDWLNQAAGINQTLGGIITIAAAPLGALALAALPFQGALLIDVATALLAVALLFLYRIPQPQRDTTQPSSIWGDFVDGVRMVAHHRGLRLLYGVVTLMVVLIMPVFNLMPLFVATHFGGNVNQVALMQGIGGFGLIAGGIVTFVLNFRRKIVTLLVAYALACALIAATALTPSALFWVSVVCWTLGASAFSAGNATLIALLQSQVPNIFQGRVISLLTTLMGLASPIGLGLVALLGAQINVRDVFIIGGSLAAAICLLGFLAPSLVRIEESPIVPDA
jgi:DHA3 family macrolide efflux protein-like MFS transporter